MPAHPARSRASRRGQWDRSCSTCQSVTNSPPARLTYITRSRPPGWADIEKFRECGKHANDLIPSDKQIPRMCRARQKLF